jgi:thiol:disulfide interchange protein DsbD
VPLLLAAISFAGVLPAVGQTYGGRELVKAQLVADTTAIVPGKPFTVGLLLRMVPGWHTYWKYPGDAGLPTEVKWKLPSDWKVSEIEWPIPLRLEEPGDIQVYGYHTEVLLMQQITPPASVSEPTVKLTADANWLVCEKICIPGHASLNPELPVAGEATAANEEIFARYRRALPQRWPGTNVATFQWQRTGSDLRLTIDSTALANYPFVEFFPRPPEKVVVGHPKTESIDNGKVIIRVPLESEDQKLSSLPGDVVFGQAAEAANRNAWELPDDLAAKTSAPPPPARGLLTFLLFGFIGGFILNLMPCVLPVISLKIFGFIQQAGQDRQKVLRSGLAFIAGIFVWFLGLAFLLIALKAAGHQITWAAQFTNPYFVLALGVIVLVFALNLFGVFEISAPQAVMRVAGATGHGDAGAFFQGVFATILATPCTAPFLGTALGFAFTQSAVVILAMFVAIAAGMSAPYFLLSAQPAWLRFLPKPGPWMEHVKQFMGFLLLATLLFLLYVLGAQRGTEAVIWAASFLLIVSIACWMKGAFITPMASLATRSIVLVLMLVLVLVSGWYFIGEKFRSSNIAANVPISGDWNAFTPERLKTELDQGHAVFIDFTAAWCITCKFNEATVLETSAVRDAFRLHGIVKFKADWTNADPEITKLLKQFGRPGVPLYVLYPKGKFADPIVFPELLTKNILLEKIQTMGGNVSVK